MAVRTLPVAALMVIICSERQEREVDRLWFVDTIGRTGGSEVKKILRFWRQISFFTRAPTYHAS